MDKFLRYMRFLKQIDRLQFFYLNWFCKQIVRTGKGKIIPYKNTIINISDTAKMFVGDEDLEFGCNKLKKSKAETLIRLADYSVWSASGGCKISYGSTIEILKGAVLDHGYFTMNSNSTLVIKERATIGQDVMISRNVVIYDSDFHKISDTHTHKEMTRKVHIGNHVWIGANAMILKGAVLGDGCIVAADCIIFGTVQKNSLIASERTLITLKENVVWER